MAGIAGNGNNFVGADAAENVALDLPDEGIGVVDGEFVGLRKGMAGEGHQAVGSGEVNAVVGGGANGLAVLALFEGDMALGDGLLEAVGDG